MWQCSCCGGGGLVVVCTVEAVVDNVAVVDMMMSIHSTAATAIMMIQTNTIPMMLVAVVDCHVQCSFGRAERSRGKLKIRLH